MAIVAGGLDLGGTKIEAQLFDGQWQSTHRQRWPTPKDYNDLVAAMRDAVAWCQAHGGMDLPVGVSAAGRINPKTGLTIAANLAASNRPFPADVETATHRPITWINDCLALALSEWRFGAAKGADPAVAIIFGTGLSGGVIVQGQIMPSFSGLGGEIGHGPLPAGPMLCHGLPLLSCGCGRTGCAETLLSAPGLARIAAHVLGPLAGENLSAEAVIAGKAARAEFQKAWDIWLELASDFLISLCFAVDPAVIVLGGGLSNAKGITEDLSRHLQRATLKGFASPPVRLAQGGDSSGARGAAYAAWQKGQP